MKVRKADGELVEFDPFRLHRSLQRAGADARVIGDIVAAVEAQLVEGRSTQQIYREAFAMLRRKSHAQAARYKLKQAIMELGPSGYPFERFMAEVLRCQGYETEVGQHIEGRCVRHEIDVLARRGAEELYIECKFRNRPGEKVDVKVAMYVHARMRDVFAALPEVPGVERRGWIAANTRFSEDAMQYARCAGLYLLGWDYPAQGNLKERIESAGIYPLTCLAGLQRAEKQALLGRDIVLCRDLQSREHVLEEIGVPARRGAHIMREVRELCA